MDFPAGWATDDAGLTKPRGITSAISFEDIDQLISTDYSDE